MRKSVRFCWFFFSFGDIFKIERENDKKRTLLTRCLYKYPLICFENHLPQHFVRNKFKSKECEPRKTEEAAAGTKEGKNARRMEKKNQNRNTLQSNRNFHGAMHRMCACQTKPNPIDCGLYFFFFVFFLLCFSLLRRAKKMNLERRKIGQQQ